MNDLWVWVALLCVLSGFVGLVSILVPLRFLKIRSRLQGLIVFLGSFFLFVVSAVMYSAPQSGSVENATKNAVAHVAPAEMALTKPLSQSTPAAEAAVRKVEPSLPLDQKAFIDAVTGARAAYKGGANEMAKGAARPARAKAVCSAAPSGRAQDWIGTLTTLSSNSEGKGVMAISIAKDLTVKTWNNAVSDIGDKTLIEAGTPLFNQASSLSVGSKVKFSGVFSRESTDCFREASMTLQGSMDDPEYIMRFQAIEPVK